jgi:hypothetical protein
VRWFKNNYRQNQGSIALMVASLCPEPALRLTPTGTQTIATNGELFYMDCVLNYSPSELENMDPWHWQIAGVELVGQRSPRGHWPSEKKN